MTIPFRLFIADDLAFDFARAQVTSDLAAMYYLVLQGYNAASLRGQTRSTYDWIAILLGEQEPPWQEN